MEDLELTHEEKKELEKRGFFVKNLISFKDILTTFPLFLGVHYLSFFILIIPTTFLGDALKNYSFFISIIIPWLFNQSIFLYFISKLFLTYIFQAKTFYYTDKQGGISYIKKKIGNYLLKIFSDWIYIMREIFGTKLSFDEVFIKAFVLFILFFPLILLFLIIIFIKNNFFLDNVYTEYVIPLITVFLSFYIIGYILRQLVEHIMPMYAFGNLGEKIQSLTPKIEEQSKLIQKGFKKNMNYSVLSHGFDSLSATFSEIISLVIKLEKVEARANKGNLFDSEKYINSLRSDIVTPLTSLKAFLEKQKSELMQSQQELTRVRVGGNESSGNIELQSKRSESLITELTENIEKLDVMIGKMG